MVRSHNVDGKPNLFIATLAIVRLPLFGGKEDGKPLHSGLHLYIEETYH